MNTTNSTRRTINKTKKHVYKPTLDVQHNLFVNTINDTNQERNNIIAQLKVIENDIKEIENEMRSVDVVDEKIVKKFTDLKDKKIKIEDRLKKIDADFNEDNYYTNTASILFEYYDLVEKGNTHSDGITAVQTDRSRASILDYFKIANQDETEPNSTSIVSGEGNVSACAAADEISYKPETESASRGALLSKYMQYTDPEYAKTSITMQNNNNTEEECQHCKSTKLMVMTNDGFIWCTNCDAIEYIIIDHEKPSYRDPPKEISFFAYKRSNHLNEWISQIQGKETTEIPEEIYDKILMEIRKQKITNMADLTQKKIKSILKTLQINRYYEHSAHIINRLTGVPMKQLSPELEEQLRNMFMMIQTPFLKHAPKSRKNFLSYSFVLHKLVQLLGKDEYLENFPLLKSRDKLYQQDMVWRKICEDVNWEFYPSL